MEYVEHGAESTEQPRAGGIPPLTAEGTGPEAVAAGAVATVPEGMVPVAPPQWQPQVPRRRIWQRRALGLTLVFAVLAVCGLVILLQVHEQTGTQGFLVGLALATLPTPLLLLAFRWLDRVDPTPWRTLGFAFAWGACAATLVSLLANSFAAEWIATGLPVGRVREVDVWAASLVAPVVEETAKAGALLLIFLFQRRHFAGLLNGIVMAGVIATGFAFTENILYLGSAFAEDRALGYDTPVSTTAVTFIARGIFSPFAHPLFTAMTGLGFGLAALAARERRTRARRILLPLAGLLAAMLMHGMWNGSVVFGGVGFLAVYGLFMVPVFGLLIWLAVWARGAVLRTVREQLTRYAQAGWLTPPEPTALSSVAGRKLARDLVLRTHGKPGRAAVAAYETAATELALLRSRAERGDAAGDFTTREAALLSTLAQHAEVARLPLTQAAWAVRGPVAPVAPMGWYGPPGGYGAQAPSGGYGAQAPYGVPGGYGIPGVYGTPAAYGAPGMHAPAPGTPAGYGPPAQAPYPAPHPPGASYPPPPRWGTGGGRYS
ncbi:PrsW family glutamic-type intramembrane protease [Streptomyces polyrhachis]|uniref:PrsW family glutamic-type intramembrane protease n=1 Tax=Streptomyces polyrhachis TaxID=1282885 RepID=A0ABW2GKI6_9ACTN